MAELLAKPHTTRVQLELSPHELETMNWLMEVCGIKTRKDLFNNAVALLEWAVGEVADGKKIASFNDNTKERNILSMPALNAAAGTHRRYAKKESSYA